MNVREMHIEVEQSTQQVAANRGRKWYPEEIDWVLNKMQERFVASCLRPRQDGSGGFELDQSKADQIRMLIRTQDLTPWLDGSYRYKCHLPGDYAHLLADQSDVKNLCGAAAPTPTDVTLYIARQLQHITAKESAPFYETMSLEMPGIELILADLLEEETIYTGFPDKKDYNFLVPVFLHYGNRQSDLHWEYFDNLYYRNNYITVTTTEPGATVLSVDEDPYATGSIQTRNVQKHVVSGIVMRTNNRLCASDIIPSLNQSVNFKSSYYSPISELQGTNLLVHRHDSFIVTGVTITYIRKPRPISLHLSADCELAGEATHKAICDLATEYLKGTTQNAEGRQLKAVDISERVTL